MAHPALPWLIGGGAAALVAYLASQSQDAPPNSYPPLVDPAWREKYSLDPTLLMADRAERAGVELLKPGQGQLLTDSNLQVTADVGPNRAIQISAPQVKSQIDAQQAFAAKWGIKQVWAASELIQRIDTAPDTIKLLFRFGIANDVQAKQMDAMTSGRLTIVLDTVESVQYFSGVLLIALLASFDAKTKQTINLDKPYVKNLFRLFSYHDWRVSEGLTEYQLETLNRFVGSPVEQWMRDAEGNYDQSEIDYFDASGPYHVPNEPDTGFGAWYRCVPNEYPGMNIPDSPTADPSYYMRDIKDDGKHWRWVPKGSGGYWVKNKSSRIEPGYFKDHLGNARPFAKKVLGDGRLWLFEYASLRLQNIQYAAGLINGVSDLAGQAVTALVGAVQGLIKLAAGNIAGAVADLAKAALEAIIILVKWISEMIDAEAKNEALQRAIESHLNTLLGLFWGLPNVQSYLSGYQLGLIPNFQEGYLHAGYRYGASRSVSFFMRNWVMVHDQPWGIGICGGMHLPQIPLFMRGVPFAVITSVSRDHLIAIESVYGYLFSQKTRAKWAQEGKPSNLRVDINAKGPVGVRILEIHRGTSAVKVIHGPGKDGPAVPFKQYNPGFGLPGVIVKQEGVAAKPIL
jgi:hypothetical protein